MCTNKKNTYLCTAKRHNTIISIPMNSHLLLRAFFSFLPFLMCLFWLIIFVVQYRKLDEAKRMLTLYIGTCVLLYFCHALFFTVGLSYEMECLWTLCSLSVYPLFYGYLGRLTSSDYTLRQLLPLLLPGAVVALAKYIFPNAGMDVVRLLLFAIQVICVCYLGLRRLKKFDHRLQAVYADTEGRDTKAVYHLLIAIICVSILAGVANSLGKAFFGESLYLLVPISLAFTVILYTLNYICFHRDFTIDELIEESKDSETVNEPTALEDSELIGRKIEALMKEQQIFLTKNLKITDVAKAIGSNRTYVSNYINNTYHCSFSDYINQLRIEHAKTLLLSSDADTKLSTIAEASGYSSESSFYRNFQKVTGMTPSEFKNTSR